MKNEGKKQLILVGKDCGENSTTKDAILGKLPNGTDLLEVEEFDVSHRTLLSRK